MDINEKIVNNMEQWYIAFHTENGISWRIRNTDNDLDSSDGIQNEIEDIEKNFCCKIVPIFWKKLKC